MYNFYIDPFLLAYPRADVEIEEFENYINSLTSWGEEIEKIKDINFAGIYTSAQTAEILAEENGYPERNELEKTIKNLNLQRTVQPRDIIILIEGLMRFPFIEDRLKLNEILIDNIECNPSCHIDERNSIFIEHYNRLAILMCLLCKLKNFEDKTQILVTRHRKEDSTSISVKGEVIDYEFCDDTQLWEIPNTVSGCLVSCVNASSLDVFIDALTIWVHADCEKTYKYAIDIYTRKETLKSEIPKNSLTWSFGKNFLESAKNLEFLNNEIRVKMLLRACAETILEQKLQATHWLRTGKGANNPQKKRNKDQAGAWRRDIDREYHLHYWQTANELEFASVVSHNDMSIPE